MFDLFSENCEYREVSKWLIIPKTRLLNPIKSKDKSDKTEGQKTNDKVTQNVENAVPGKEVSVKLPTVQKAGTENAVTLPRIKKKPTASAGSAAQLDPSMEFQSPLADPYNYNYHKL